MAKKIIILDKMNNGNIKVIFWLDVPATRQSFYADPNNSSQYPDATAGELIALQNGSVTEKIEIFGIDPVVDLAGAKTFLQNQLILRQAEIDGLNQWQRYGSFYDGTAWTGGGAL